MNHRSGSLFEDMYWINPDTISIVAREIDKYQSTIAKYHKRGYDEYNSQILTLEEMRKRFDISFKEVL